MVGKKKEAVEDVCKIPGWVHSDSINLERESERIIELVWEEEKLRVHF